MGGGRYVGSRLLRNNSQIAGGTSGGSGNESVYTDTGLDSLDHHSFSYMDTPGAGNHTYKVLVDAKGCLDSMEISVLVSPIDTVIITNPPSLCSSDNPYQLTLDPSKTTSGSWTDLSGGNTTITSAGIFDPFGLSDGQYQVVFTSDGTCPGADTASVTVTDKINFVFTDGDTTFCMNHTPDTVNIPLNTGGGKFWTTSGQGVSTDSMYVVISRYTSNQTGDSLYYGKAGQCGDTAGIEITILDVDVSEVDSVVAVCSDTPAFDYTYSSSSTIGGAWSGNGITDGTLGTFSPTDAITVHPFIEGEVYKIPSPELESPSS